MKFYNPWKPHIIQLNDKFYVRRLSPFTWAYLDRDRDHWWLDRTSHARFDDADKAADALLEYPAYRKKQKALSKTKKLDTEKLLQQSRTRKVLQLDAVEEEPKKPQLGDFRNSSSGHAMVYDGKGWQPITTLRADSIVAARERYKRDN